MFRRSRSSSCSGSARCPTSGFFGVAVQRRRLASWPLVLSAALLLLSVVVSPRGSTSGVALGCDHHHGHHQHDRPLQHDDGLHQHHNHHRQHYHSADLEEEERFLSETLAPDTNSSYYDNSTGLVIEIEAETNGAAYRCGFETPSMAEREIMASAVFNWMQANQGRRLNIVQHEIPVDFFVFQSSPGEGVVSYSRLLDTISSANVGLGGSPFRLRFNRAFSVINQEFARCENEVGWTSKFKRSGVDVMTVYLCDTHKYLDTGGRTRPPPVTDVLWTRKYDGILLMNGALPTASWRIVKQSFIHEIGHWLVRMSLSTLRLTEPEIFTLQLTSTLSPPLPFDTLFLQGLYHTFEDGCSAVPEWQYQISDKKLYDYFTGDGVKDTAAHAQPSIFENPDHPNKITCFQGWDLDTCPDNIPGVDPGLDPVSNYMNFGYGACRLRYGHFTPGQIQRMTAEYETFRTKCKKFKSFGCRRNACCHGLHCRRNSNGHLQCLRPTRDLYTFGYSDMSEIKPPPPPCVYIGKPCSEAGECCKNMQCRKLSNASIEKKCVPPCSSTINSKCSKFRQCCGTLKCRRSGSGPRCRPCRKKGAQCKTKIDCCRRTHRCILKTAQATIKTCQPRR